MGVDLMRNASALNPLFSDKNANLVCSGFCLISPWFSSGPYYAFISINSVKIAGLKPLLKLLCVYFTVSFFQVNLTQANVFRCYLNILIALDVFHRFLK